MTDARPALFAHRLGYTEQPVGLRWRSGRRTVTEFDLMNFVTTCGFSESLFMDAEAAAQSETSKPKPRSLWATRWKCG